jgi:hypothetical protein
MTGRRSVRTEPYGAPSGTLSLLTCNYSVELPEIETASLPGVLASELPVHSVSFRFIPARYLRLCFRVLTASRAVAGGDLITPIEASAIDTFVTGADQCVAGKQKTGQLELSDCP